jgi:hypothetical protein
LIPTDRLFAAAKAKTKGKDTNGDYGFGKGREAWETMPIESLAAAVKYKVDRAIQPGTSIAKSEDDLGDAAAFLAAIYERKIPAAPPAPGRRIG